MSEPIIRNKILEHFDSIAGDYGGYKEKNSYYYSQVKGLYGELISCPAEHSILEIGCGTAFTLKYKIKGSSKNSLYNQTNFYSIFTTKNMIKSIDKVITNPEDRVQDLCEFIREK